VRARALGRKPWGRISILLQSFKNAFKAEIYTKVYLKMRIF